MAVDFQGNFKAQLEAAIAADEQQLTRFRQLRDTAKARVAKNPDDYNLQIQVELHESVIKATERKITDMRDALGKLR